jgi:hypothetical protein
MEEFSASHFGRLTQILIGWVSLRADLDVMTTRNISALDRNVFPVVQSVYSQWACAPCSGWCSASVSRCWTRKAASLVFLKVGIITDCCWVEGISGVSEVFDLELG